MTTVAPDIHVRSALTPVVAGQISVNSVLRRIGAARPVGLIEVVRGLEPVTLHFRLDDATCSGFCDITLSRDGRVRYRGHVHNSGLLDARYIAITSIPVAPAPVLIAHQSSAGGTVGLDPRDDDWDLKGTSRLAADNWWSVRTAALRARTDFGASTGAFEVVSSLFGTALLGVAAGELVFSI